jgi:hypothetical protein
MFAMNFRRLTCATYRLYPPTTMGCATMRCATAVRDALAPYACVCVCARAIERAYACHVRVRVCTASVRRSTAKSLNVDDESIGFMKDYGCGI